MEIPEVFYWKILRKDRRTTSIMNCTSNNKKCFSANKIRSNFRGYLSRFFFDIFGGETLFIWLFMVFDWWKLSLEVLTYFQYEPIKLWPCYWILVFLTLNMLTINQFLLKHSRYRASYKLYNTWMIFVSVLV